jgi:predicted molibdopterin-dependent oxidoreductase YjgC
MSLRITKNVTRPPAVTIQVNGTDVTAHEGESLATALIAADVLTMSRDSSGRLRSPWCNMGVCFDCLVEIEDGSSQLRVRACLTPVRAGLRITVPQA